MIANWVGLADVAGYTTSGWGHIHTIYRDPTNDYANSVTQQDASGMGGGGAPARSMGTSPRRLTLGIERSQGIAQPLASRACVPPTVM